MKHARRKFLVLVLAETLAVLPALPARKVTTRQLSSITLLEDDLRKSYLELFQLAPKLHFTAGEIPAMRLLLAQSRDSCVNKFKRRSAEYESEAKDAQHQLKRVRASDDESERHALHCKIQNLEELRSQSELLASKAVPVAYENKKAKLELIERWPAQYGEIRQEISSRSYRNRRWGDVQDIGFREIASGQEKDVKTGKEIIKQMKTSHMMPPELEDKAIEDYVKKVGEKVAANSDLKVPLQVTVLNSKEINAFALPGGYLFVERGLLEAAEDESELAGVLAHEMGHVVARHSHKLMTRATIAQAIFQAAQVAAVIATGGVVGLGTYYALQYGFYGLGMVLDLKLLGVSREYELQADQLGIQYARKSGYDPNGFIRFFDKMATKVGYVNGMSWFRTHPPFYERMVNAEREILFLPKKENFIVDTSAFKEMKTRLVKVSAKASDEEKNRPTLREKGCPKPSKIAYQPGEPVEKLCSQDEAG